MTVKSLVLPLVLVQKLRIIICFNAEDSSCEDCLPRKAFVACEEGRKNSTCDNIFIVGLLIDRLYS